MHSFLHPLIGRTVCRFILGGLALLLPHLAPAGIDLTPRYIDTFIDGAAFRRLYFADGDKKFGISLNRETEATADSGGVLFRFTKVPDATFLVVRSRHSPTDKFEGVPLERYRESAKRLLPVQARESVIREEIENPFPINNWRSHRFVISFELAGLRQLQSVTFLNLSEDDQVVLIISAPESIFEEAAHRSFQIFRTWQELLPGDEKPARGS